MRRRNGQIFGVLLGTFRRERALGAIFFDQNYIFYLGLEGQPEVENTPTSLYMGERAWNELFQNIYFVLGILHCLEGTEP